MKLGTTPNLVTIPEGADPLLARIEKVAQKGLQAMNVFISPNVPRDPAYYNRVADLAGKLGVDLRMGAGGNFYLQGDEGKAEIDRVADNLRFAAEHMGIRYSSLASGPMLTSHRFAPGKPLDERKQILSENLGRLADAVKDAGVTLALENHCDWRGHEIVEIVKGANRPNLKMQLDTGNAFSVFEEPVDCARAMAPWVVSCHLKDIHVTPFATGEVRGSRAVTVPLGEGHVDNVEVCRILKANAPDADSIVLLIEPFYLDPGSDVDAFFNTSVAWAQEHLAPFLDAR